MITSEIFQWVGNTTVTISIQLYGDPERAPIHEESCCSLYERVDLDYSFNSKCRIAVLLVCLIEPFFLPRYHKIALISNNPILINVEVCS